MGLRQIWALLRDSFRGWQEDNASQLAAALSYYTAISIAPLLVIVIAIASLALDTKTAQDALVAQTTSLVGVEGGAAIETIVEHADRPRLATLAGILGAITLVWSSANVFAQLQDSLNTIWGVEPKPGRGLWSTLKARFLSFGMVVVIGFMLLVSLVVSAALSAAGEYLSTSLPGGDVLWQLVNFVISFAVITLLFALMFKVLPDLRIAWRDVWLGAAVTALLFVIGKYLIGLYLGNQSIGSSYGAAGSLVVFLLWVYYSAQIFFFGAEFTQVYARRYGAGIAPDAGARFVDGQAPGRRAQTGTAASSAPSNAPSSAPSSVTARTQRVAPRTSSRFAPRIARIEIQPDALETRSTTMKKVQNPISMLNADEIAAHAEQLQEAAHALAMEMRSQTGQAVHRTTEQAKASATKLADEARRKVESKVDEQKSAAAARLDNVASVLRKTSKELHRANEDALANYTGSAAEQFERLASALRPPQSNSMFARIGRFASHRPVMFVLTLLAAIFGLRMAIKNFDRWSPMFSSADRSHQSWNGSHHSAHSGPTAGSSTGSSPE